MRSCSNCRHFDGLDFWCILYDRHAVAGETCEEGWEPPRHVHRIGVRDDPQVPHGPRQSNLPGLQADGPRKE